MPTLTLAPLGIARAEGLATLGWELRAEGTAPFVLTHALPEAQAGLFTDPGRGDHALAVALLHAMARGLDIRVAGAVSPRLLDGLETLQAIWHRWVPARYTPVRIAVETEAEAPAAPADAGAVVAFSGGVDGTYSFFRHLTGAAGRATRRPAAALLVHGMDIPLDQPETFAGALARGARMLEGTDVPILPMRTSARSLGMSWEQSYGLQLIGCFLCLQGSFRAAVKASGEPWEGLVMPWGSTPLTDPLCSTAVMEILHDGCEASRTEKVDWLVRQTSVSGDLRVCWEGPALDRNCGQCEKCVRTMLNFWCLGHPVPGAFPAPLRAEQVLTIPVRNRIQLAELESILRLAEGAHGVQDPILRALKRRVAQEQARLRRAEIGRTLKTAVKARLGPELSGRLGRLRAGLRC
jgi:hypothetical protein